MDLAIERIVLLLQSSNMFAQLHASIAITTVRATVGPPSGQYRGFCASFHPLSRCYYTSCGMRGGIRIHMLLTLAFRCATELPEIDRLPLLDIESLSADAGMSVFWYEQTSFTLHES